MYVTLSTWHSSNVTTCDCIHSFSSVLLLCPVRCCAKVCSVVGISDCLENRNMPWTVQESITLSNTHRDKEPLRHRYQRSI